MADQQLILMLTGSVAAASVPVAGLGAIGGWPLASVTGLVLAAVFGTGFAVVATRSEVRRERVRRRARAGQLGRDLDAAARRWDDADRAGRREFDARGADLQQAYDRGRRARLQLQADRHRLDADRRQHQLDDFPARQLIRNHEIALIGKGRLTTRLSFGIETAADPNRYALSGIPTLGDQSIGNLMA